MHLWLQLGDIAEGGWWPSSTKTVSSHMLNLTGFNIFSWGKYNSFALYNFPLITFVSCWLSHLPLKCRIYASVNRVDLVQIMACRLFGAKPISKPILGYCQLATWDENSGKFQSKYNFFIPDNAYENIICEMVSILSTERWVTRARWLKQSCFTGWKG